MIFCIQKMGALTQKLDIAWLSEGARRYGLLNPFLTKTFYGIITRIFESDE